VKIETRTESHPDQRYAEIKVTTRNRWTRFVATFGTPPGSHIGFWRTNWFSLKGWNLRVGRRYQTCLTLFIHTKETS
jgi:hypothetical protein